MSWQLCPQESDRNGHPRIMSVVGRTVDSEGLAFRGWLPFPPQKFASNARMREDLMSTVKYYEPRNFRLLSD